MVQRLLSILILFLTITSFGQNERVNISRTKISCDQLDGFRLDSTLALLINDTDNAAAIQFSDLDGGNFKKNTENFTVEGFKKKGVPITFIKDTLIDGYSAIIAIANNEEQNFESLMLVFGDSTFSVMVNALYEYNKPAMDKQEIMELVFSVKYDENRSIDCFEGVIFNYPKNNTFNFKSCAGSFFLFTHEDDDSIKIVTTQLPMEVGQTLVGVAANAIFQTKSEGWSNYEITSENYCKEDKNTCLSVQGICTVNGEAKTFYFRFLMDKKRIVICTLFVVNATKTNHFEAGKAFINGIDVKQNP